MNKSMSNSKQTKSNTCCDLIESDTCCDSTESDACYEIPSCCDMRGLLSFQILWLLSKKPMHGQEIAEELQKRRGFKPSPGTLYPALKRLEGFIKDTEESKKEGKVIYHQDERKRYIKGEKEGRKIVYRLVEEKSGEIDQACRYFCYVFADIFEEYSSKKH